MGNGGESQNPFPLDGMEVAPLFLRAHQSHRLVVTMEDDGARMDLSKQGFNRLTALRRFYLRENEEVCSAEMVQGLPENASRQKMMISEADGGVNQKDVKIPVKLNMLKPVIQNKSADPEPLKSVLTVSEAIFSNENGNTLQGLRHEVRLITGLFR